MKISVQTAHIVDEVGLDKAYRLIRETGFEAIDWNLDILLPCDVLYAGKYEGYSILEKPLDEILKALEPELNEIRKNGLTITQAHAPFPAHSVKQPGVYPFMFKIYENCIRLCDAIGCKNLVIHGVNYQKRDYGNTAEDIDELNWKMYTALIPVLRETNVTVCLENLFSGGPNFRGSEWVDGHCANPYEAIKLIDALNAEAGKECFGLCLDTGHLNLLHGDPRTYIPLLGKRIKALHIHDNNGVNDLHIAPYNGNIIWKQYYTALRQIGYEGDLNFETFNQTTLKNIEEELLPSQLRAIAAVGELFRKRIQE